MDIITQDNRNVFSAVFYLDMLDFGSEKILKNYVCIQIKEDQFDFSKFSDYVSHNIYPTSGDFVYIFIPYNNNFIKDYTKIRCFPLSWEYDEEGLEWLCDTFDKCPNYSFRFKLNPIEQLQLVSHYLPTVDKRMGTA
jgi:hypothetical protein